MFGTFSKTCEGRSSKGCFKKWFSFLKDHYPRVICSFKLLQVSPIIGLHLKGDLYSELAFGIDLSFVQNKEIILETTFSSLLYRER